MINYFIYYPQNSCSPNHSRSSKGQKIINYMYMYLSRPTAALWWSIRVKIWQCMKIKEALHGQSGPSCSKLTMSLANDSLKFPSSDSKYAKIFCWKNVSSFCSAKAAHIFSAKNIRILYKTVNEMTLNELVKLTMLRTTGPRDQGLQNMRFRKFIWYTHWKLF